MPDLHAVRRSMMKWNLFMTACIFVAGLLLKVGAPFPAVASGIGLAAFVNWKGRRHQHPLKTATPTAEGGSASQKA